MLLHYHINVIIEAVLLDLEHNDSAIGGLILAYEVAISPYHILAVPGGCFHSWHGLFPSELAIVALRIPGLDLDFNIFVARGAVACAGRAHEALQDRRLKTLVRAVDTLILILANLCLIIL